LPLTPSAAAETIAQVQALPLEQMEALADALPYFQGPADPVLDE